MLPVNPLLLLMAVLVLLVVLQLLPAVEGFIGPAVSAPRSQRSSSRRITPLAAVSTAKPEQQQQQQQQSTTMMDAIIEPRRIEAMEGFHVADRISGVAFVRADPLVGSSSSSSSSNESLRSTVLFLPGLDGSGCTLGPQVADLRRNFDLWSLSVPPDDRSPFHTLVHAVVTHLERQAAAAHPSGAPPSTVLVGESFGGLLALGVLLSLGDRASQLGVHSALVINPATSFDRTPWPLAVPLFRGLPPQLYPWAVTPVLVGVGPDRTQFLRVLGRIVGGNKKEEKKGNGNSPTPATAAAAATLPLPAPFPALPLPPPLEELRGLVAFLTQTIPLDTLQWRISRWLQAGTARVNGRLGEIQTPVVVAVGSEDRLLPSLDEAGRLARRLPDCSLIRLQGSGHISLDARVNLTDILIRNPRLQPPPSTPLSPKKGEENGGRDRGGASPSSSTSPLSAKKEEEGGGGSRGRGASASPPSSSPLSPKKGRKEVDPVKDFVKPGPQTVKRYMDLVERFLGRFVSPQFFSDAGGAGVQEGLGGVPLNGEGRPVLLVGNHQLYGVDLGLIIGEFLQERGMLVRGLAHPALFQERRRREGEEGSWEEEVIFTEDVALFSTGFSVATAGGNGDGREDGERETNGLRNVFQSFGAVPVTPRNFYALLEQGDAVLLFPGGARETYHRKGESYQLFWPEQGEFVRMAARCNATIVPFSAVGADDSFDMILDAEELKRLPLGLGQRVKAASDATPNARGAGNPEDFIAPVVFPKIPSRFYFKFGRPIDAAAAVAAQAAVVGEGVVNRKEAERAAAQRVYGDVKTEVERGITALLEARKADRFRNFPQRVAYEQLLLRDGGGNDGSGTKKRRAPTFSPAELQRVYERVVAMEERGEARQRR